MLCIFHVSELWWGCSKFPCALKVLFTLYLGLILLPSFLVAWRIFSCRLTWVFFDFRFLSHRAPSFLVPADSCSFIVIPRIDQRSQTWWRNLSLHWLRITRLTGLAFAVGEPSFEVVFCPRFDMVPIMMRSLTWERKLLKWLQEYIEKLITLNKHRKWFHSCFEKLPLVRMSTSCFLVSTYLIWILGSKLILSNNQSRATLWVLDRRVSSSDFDLKLLFWSRLRCLQRCTTDEKNVWWWVRNPPHSIAQPSVFFWHVGS